jgi:hypothetical protein
VVGAFVKLFRFKAVNPDNQARAGVSTKPLDGALVELELRERSPAECAVATVSGDRPAFAELPAAAVSLSG